MRPKEADTDLFVGGRNECGVLNSPVTCLVCGKVC